MDERLNKDNTYPSLLSMLFSEDPDQDYGDNQQDQELKRKSSPHVASVKTKRSRGELENGSRGAQSPLKVKDDPNKYDKQEMSVESEETKIKSLVESIEQAVGKLRDIHANKENRESFSNDIKSLLKPLAEQLIALS